MKDRIKNPYFWIGLVGVILTALQVEASTLTSWDKVLQLIIDTIQNPYLLTTTVMAVIGVVVDPTTRGAKDRKVVR
ncbi:holin, phage phi LC3 family [Peptostreptococcus russellii]|uniref:Holin, phage phi LC3 family n=1 Tax=Peptostreptococcus russellii TaxID=215200 RepID=A0A1H8JG79_9FIRM|nr:phage holin [Peptostreptococcus russellii]SEN79759.1 holin, phage phi LC3 family [Peptostreptococcus russellii]